MAEEKDKAFRYVKEWTNALISRGPLELPEELNQFESCVLKDIAYTFPEPGHLVATFRVPPHLVNKYDTLHGGAIATLIDVFGITAVKTVVGFKRGASSDINISYISGAALNLEVELEARVLRAGRTMAVASVDLRNKATKALLSQGRVTVYLSKQPFNIKTAKL